MRISMNETCSCAAAIHICRDAPLAQVDVIAEILQTVPEAVLGKPEPWPTRG